MTEPKPTHDEIAILANRHYKEALAAFPTAEDFWRNAERELEIEMQRGAQETE